MPVVIPAKLFEDVSDIDWIGEGAAVVGASQIEAVSVVLLEEKMDHARLVVDDGDRIVGSSVAVACDSPRRFPRPATVCASSKNDVDIRPVAKVEISPRRGIGDDSAARGSHNTGDAKSLIPTNAPIPEDRAFETVGNWTSGGCFWETLGRRQNDGSDERQSKSDGEGNRRSIDLGCGYTTTL